MTVLVAMDGKPMIACMSRWVCVALYKTIRRLKPEWHSDVVVRLCREVFVKGNDFREANERNPIVVRSLFGYISGNSEAVIGLESQ